ncbi:hypothetical protein DL96DRAFT_1552302 [Flagelloscypha sp. PMI_526]|nr:hypothetical protein DL96DRAFT_1552302 [Flagelloscypha sp. PMI_526]
MLTHNRPGYNQSNQGLVLHKKRTAAWFAACFFSLVAVILAILFSVDYGGPIGENEMYSEADGKDGVVLAGHIFDVKPSERATQISWYPVFCGQYYSSSTSASASNPFNGGSMAQCGRPNRQVDIYVDGQYGNPAWTFDPSTIPTLDNGTQTAIEIPQYSFITASTLFMYTFVFGANKHVIGLDFFYPFTRYELTHNFLVIDSSTNTSIPVLNAAIVTASDSYIPYKTRSSEFAGSGFKIPWSTNGAKAETYSAKLSFTLSTIAKFFSVALFTINWSLALLVLFMTVLFLVRIGQVGGGLPESVMVVPVTIIVTIPALRALFIGNPPFGHVFDVLGFFPQMIVVAICSIILLSLMLRPNHSSPQLTGSISTTVPLLHEEGGTHYRPNHSVGAW